MPLINVLAENIETGVQKTFILNNVTGEVFDNQELAENSLKEITPVSLADTGKNGPFRVIKIQMGLSCNYDCSYCSQRFVARDENETSAKDIEAFESMFAAIPKTEQFRVEFWGGEPFVYWKTMKPLAEMIHERYPNARLSVITNGSLLTPDKILWLDRMGFHVSISHDGPGQAHRGPDPLVDNGRNIRLLLELLLPLGRASINTMLHAKNQSRLAVIEWFEKELPDMDFPFGEMGIIDAYDDDGLAKITLSKQEHFDWRRQLWSELRFMSKVLKRCPTQAQQVFSQRDAARGQMGQKCGMDREDIIAVDLRGNIVTCQNVSAVAVAPNGQSHKIGHVNDLSAAKLTTSTHWTERDHCSKCPVLSLCGGSCMFLQGERFYASCDGSFDDKVALLAASFEQRTGYVPFKFDDPSLPEYRQDIWGALRDWTGAEEKPARKTIPIKQIDVG